MTYGILRHSGQCGMAAQNAHPVRNSFAIDKSLNHDRTAKAALARGFRIIRLYDFADLQRCSFRATAPMATAIVDREIRDCGPEHA